MRASGNRCQNNNTIYKFKPFVFEKVDFPIQNDKITFPHPHPRSGHRIAADSSNFYSFGGYNPLIRARDYYHCDDDDDDNDDSCIDSLPLFRELWKFNFALKKWTKFNKSSSLPKVLVSNATLLHGNSLMIYGGTGSPFGTRCSNQLYIINVNDESNKMKKIKTAGQLPLAQYGQAIVYHNDYLYAIGGTTGFEYSCDIHRLNLKTLTWEIVYICNGTGKYEPSGRYRHEVGFDGKKIYILGGGTAETVYLLDEFPAFDIEKKRWTQIKTIPAETYGFPNARRCHGSAQIDTGNNGVDIFITGGLDGLTLFQDLWKLNLRSMQWTFYETCQLPRPTYFHAVSMTPEGKLYIFGGIYTSVNEQVKRTRAVYSTWICIPKLSELCWEAVLHYSPQIVEHSANGLINMGLPKHFVKRLELNNTIISK